MIFNKYKLNISKYLVISLGVFGIIFYTLFIIHNPARADITTGLVGWWKFDEGSGTAAGDSSGNNNTGTLTNGPTWTTGKIGGALGEHRVKVGHEVLLSSRHHGANPISLR